MWDIETICEFPGLSAPLWTCLLYTSDRTHKEGICYEYENGVCSKKYQYKNDERLVLLCEFKEDVMIEYDDKGKRVYQGGYVLDKTKGYLRKMCIRDRYDTLIDEFYQ